MGILLHCRQMALAPIRRDQLREKKFSVGKWFVWVAQLEAFQRVEMENRVRILIQERIFLLN